MMSSDPLQRIKGTVGELQGLLRTEGYLARFPWLSEVARLVDICATSPHAVADLKAMVARVHTGPGSLHDLVIWRNNVDERKKLNDRLDALRTELFDLVEHL